MLLRTFPVDLSQATIRVAGLDDLPNHTYLGPVILLEYMSRMKPSIQGVTRE